MDSPDDSMHMPALRTPYLQSTIRVPRPLLGALPALTPRERMSQSTIYNDEGTDMFRVVRERKYVQEQLEAMQNRVQKLRAAEMKAEKKLEETRKLALEKAALRQLKQQVRDLQQNTKKKIEMQRSAARERLHEAKQSLLKAKQVPPTQDQALHVKQENTRKKTELSSLIEEDLSRKIHIKAHLIGSLQQAHQRNLSVDLESRNRVKTQFLSKKETELATKADMETRIRELETAEQRIVDNLKKTFMMHEVEIRKLETLIVAQRSPRLSSSVGFEVPRAFATDDEQEAQ